MKHLFTLSGPEVIFRHCVPVGSSSHTCGCFRTVCLDIALKKNTNQNLCYALSDQCGNGSNQSEGDGLDDDVDAAAERVTKCHTDRMCSCKLMFGLKKKITQ